MSVCALPETKSSQKNFYPTPEKLAQELLYGIKWDKVSTVLEPSAGKGDLVREIIAKLKTSRNQWRGRDDKDFDIDCVEIDPDLRHILAGKKLRVVHDDFLTLHTYKRYDVIAMNPPFDHGAEHLLKALDMQKRGGYVCCILNAETLDNPCTLARQMLVSKLVEYGADITYHEGAFLGAERRSSVRVAIVKVNVPYEAREDESDILNGVRAAQKQREAECNYHRNKLAKGDFIEAIVDRFNFEVDAGCRLIREYNALLPYLSYKLDTEEGVRTDTMLTLIAGSRYARNNDEASVNAFIRAVRTKYWRALFSNKQFMSNMTSNLRDSLLESVERLRDYDFSVFNILTIRLNMQKELVSCIHRTIIGLFDTWTVKYHWDENSANMHYFNGWRTNDAFAVNKKVIIPFCDVWSHFNGYYNPTDYKVVCKLEDIEKAFDYLTARKPFADGIRSVLAEAKQTLQTKKIQLHYFAVTFYKKGTCHIEFTDMDVLHKFNLYAAKDKNWLPPCYGKKAYKDMNAEEKAVVDSFEGKESYNRVMSHADYFLSAPIDSGIAKLGGGEDA